MKSIINLLKKNIYNRESLEYQVKALNIYLTHFEIKKYCISNKLK